MSNPFEGAIQWFQGLPTWAKIAVPVVGAGVVVLIWHPWGSSSTSTIETGAPSSGGSATGGSSAGNPNPEISTGSGYYPVPASYSNPPPATTSGGTTSTTPVTSGSRTVPTSNATSQENVATGTVTTTGTGSEILTPHPVHPRAAVRPRTAQSVGSSTISTVTNPSTGGTTIDLRLSNLTGSSTSTAPRTVNVVTNPSTGQKSVDLKLSNTGGGETVTPRIQPVTHPRTVYAQTSPSTGQTSVNLRLSDLTRSTSPTAVVDPVGSRTTKLRETRTGTRTTAVATPYYGYHPETSPFASSYHAESTSQTRTSAARTSSSGSRPVRYTRAVNASTGTPVVDLRR